MSLLFMTGLVCISGTLYLRRLLLRKLLQQVDLLEAVQQVSVKLDRVNEWLEKYPDASFRTSRHGRELLATLYQAEKRRAELANEEMDFEVLGLIDELLETDPDDDPSPNSLSPEPGLNLFILLAK